MDKLQKNGHNRGSPNNNDIIQARKYMKRKQKKHAQKKLGHNSGTLINSKDPQ